MTQDQIDSKMEKRKKGVYGPSLGKHFIIFVDDLNMPMREKYFAQPPLELLRQCLAQGGWYVYHLSFLCIHSSIHPSIHLSLSLSLSPFLTLPPFTLHVTHPFQPILSYFHLSSLSRYDRKTLQFRKIIDKTMVTAMGPPGGGRNPISERVKRWFNIIGYSEMDDASKHRIFSTIVYNFLSNGFEDEVAALKVRFDCRALSSPRLFCVLFSSFLWNGKDQFEFLCWVYNSSLKPFLFSAFDTPYRYLCTSKYLYLHFVSRNSKDCFVKPNPRAFLRFSPSLSVFLSF